jgi:hypothetical protein
MVEGSSLDLEIVSEVRGVVMFPAPGAGRLE